MQIRERVAKFARSNLDFFFFFFFYPKVEVIWKFKVFSLDYESSSSLPDDGVDSGAISAEVWAPSSTDTLIVNDREPRMQHSRTRPRGGRTLCSPLVPRVARTAEKANVEAALQRKSLC